MKRVWKPLDINGLRLYRVDIRFHNHSSWNMVNIVAAKSPSQARKLIEDIYQDSEWIEQPIITSKPLNVLQPASWWEGDEQALGGEEE